jgi:hypothetical protein
VTAVNIDYEGNRKKFTYPSDIKRESINSEWTPYKNEPYIILPFRSVIKSELNAKYAGSLNLKPMGKNLPLIPCDLRPGIVHGACFEILMHEKYNPKMFAQFLKKNESGKGNIISFSYELTSMEIEKKHKIIPGELNQFFFYKNPVTEKHMFFWCKKI